MKLRTRICDLLEIENPVFLAGMGLGIASAELVAAVSNAGGFGILGCSRLTPEQIRDVIRRTRQLSNKPFGVDILAPALSQTGKSLNELRAQIPREYWEFVDRVKKELELPDIKAPDYGLTEEFIRAQVEAFIKEGVPAFSTGLGSPPWLIDEIHAHGIKYISLVGRVKHALRAKERGADIIVAQGTEAGGHTGRIGTMTLVPQVVDAVSPTPVLAAGGIGDGRGLAAALALGAEGVWMGTVFLATPEAFTDSIRFGWLTEREVESWKQALIRAEESDAIISRVRTGKTARMIKNKLVELWDKFGLAPLPYELQTILMRDIDAAYAPYFGGQVTGMIKSIRNAEEIVQTTVEQAISILKSGSASVVETS